MAVDETSDPLERATRALRSDDDNSWIELSQTIMGRVRTLVSPAASLVSQGADGEARRSERGSKIWVSGRVLTPQLRDAVQTPTRAIESLEIVVDDDRCSAVQVELVCVYGADLQREGGEARAAVAAALTTLLGPDPLFDAARDVTVQIVDVVEGDPHAA